MAESIADDLLAHGISTGSVNAFVAPTLALANVPHDLLAQNISTGLESAFITPTVNSTSHEMTTSAVSWCDKFVTYVMGLAATNEGSQHVPDVAI